MTTSITIPEVSFPQNARMARTSDAKRLRDLSPSEVGTSARNALQTHAKRLLGFAPTLDHAREIARTEETVQALTIYAKTGLFDGHADNEVAKTAFDSVCRTFYSAPLREGEAASLDDEKRGAEDSEPLLCVLFAAHGRYLLSTGQDIPVRNLAALASLDVEVIRTQGREGILNVSEDKPKRVAARDAREWLSRRGVIPYTFNKRTGIVRAFEAWGRTITPTQFEFTCELAEGDGVDVFVRGAVEKVAEGAWLAESSHGEIVGAFTTMGNAKRAIAAAVANTLGVPPPTSPEGEDWSAVGAPLEIGVAPNDHSARDPRDYFPKAPYTHFARLLRPNGSRLSEWLISEEIFESLKKRGYPVVRYRKRETVS